MTDEYGRNHTQGRLIPRSHIKPTPTPSQGSLVREPEVVLVKEKPARMLQSITCTTYILELNEEEATWLRGVMQNPHNPTGDPTLEDEYNAKMRKAFFGAVIGAGRSNG